MNSRKRFAWVVAVAASVWMPLVALPLLVPFLYVEDMLFAKYPFLMVRCSIGLDGVAIAYYFIAFIALAALVCDLFHRRWRRIVTRIALFAVGLAIMFVIGFHVDGDMRQLLPTIEVHVADADVARISGKNFSGDEFYAILRKIGKRTGIESVVFIIDKDIGCCDFTDNFLNRCSAAGVWHCAFRTEDGDLCFDYESPYHYYMHCQMENARIAAVRIGSDGCLTYDANFQRAECASEKAELESPLFTDNEDDVFGDGKADEYAAVTVVIASNDSPVSVAVACVRRLFEAGYKKVFINRC
jgi:hypothetical protein